MITFYSKLKQTMVYHNSGLPFTNYLKSINCPTISKKGKNYYFLSDTTIASSILLTSAASFNFNGTYFSVEKDLIKDLVQPIAFDISSARKRRQEENIKLVLGAIYNENLEAFDNKSIMNIRNVERYLLLAETTIEEVVTEANSNNLLAKAISSYFAKDSSRQGCLDENSYMALVNKVFAIFNITIKKPSPKAYPTTNGIEITNTKPINIPYEDFDFEIKKTNNQDITDPLLGYVFLKQSVGTGGTQNGLLRSKTLEICDWVNKYSDPSIKFYIVVQSDVNWSDKLRADIGTGLKGNLFIRDHETFQTTLISHT